MGRRALGAPEKTTSKKRGEGKEECSGRVKKRKYNMIPEEWGEEGTEEGKTTFLYSGLEGFGGKVVRREENRSKKEERERAANMSKKITSWTVLLARGGDPPYRSKIGILMIEWEGTSRKAVTWVQEENLNVIMKAPPLSEDKKKEKVFLMAPLSMHQAITSSIKAPLKTVNTEKQNEIENKNNKLGRAPQKGGRRKVWTRLRNGLFGWRIVKLENGPRGNDLCETKIGSFSHKTLGNSFVEKGENIKKRKLEGGNFTGAIKRLNLDSGTKQTDPDLGLNHDQDN